MPQISQKIGDLVEIRPLTEVGEPYSAPEAAISGYHFTDITSDLMTKWIGAAGGVHAGQGRAMGLAGFRGTGKSHFLATLAGLLARPDLRAKVGDQHVRTEADSLGRRKVPVAIVKRGSTGSLGTDLREAIAEMINCSPASLPDDIGSLFLRTYEACQNQFFAIIIDTDADREAAVARQDGNALAEIAEAARAIGLFVAVALDDDIAGADGSNVSIAGSFAIDYLEQEHLFKIIDTNLFVKKEGFRIGDPRGV